MSLKLSDSSDQRPLSESRLTACWLIWSPNCPSPAHSGCRLARADQLSAVARLARRCNCSDSCSGRGRRFERSSPKRSRFFPLAGSSLTVIGCFLRLPAVLPLKAYFPIANLQWRRETLIVALFQDESALAIAPGRNPTTSVRNHSVCCWIPC